MSIPLALGCGAQNAEVKDPSSATCQGEPGEVESLPRYLSLELRDDGPWIDGQRVRAVDVATLLRDAAADPSIRGVAIVHEGGQLPVDTMLTEIAKAGITHVVISGMLPEALGGSEAPIGAAPATPALAAKSAPPPTAAEVAVDVSTPAEVSPAPSDKPAEPASLAPAAGEQPIPNDVSVRHYGLHIGGAKDIEGVKDSYLKPIEKHFDEFRRCHALAKNRGLKASFGVDLLLSPSGGVPKVKDYRTLIKGKDFQLCALGVFAQVRWPLPERPTVVSYSLLFKPNAAE